MAHLNILLYVCKARDFMSMFVLTKILDGDLQSITVAWCPPLAGGRGQREGFQKQLMTSWFTWSWERNPTLYIVWHRMCSLVWESVHLIVLLFCISRFTVLGLFPYLYNGNITRDWSEILHMKKNQLKGCGIAGSKCPWPCIAPLRTSQVKVGISADLGDGKDNLAWTALVDESKGSLSAFFWRPESSLPKCASLSHSDFTDSLGKSRWPIFRIASAAFLCIWANADKY